jgi:hypothetical protein
MTELKFEARWHGDQSAGLLPGCEEVTISFHFGQPLDEDTIEYWQQTVIEFSAGAAVDLISRKEK